MCDKPHPWKPAWRKPQDVIPKGTRFRHDGMVIRLRRDLPVAYLHVVPDIFAIISPLFRGFWRSRKFAVEQVPVALVRRVREDFDDRAAHYLAPVEDER